MTRRGIATRRGRAVAAALAMAALGVRCGVAGADDSWTAGSGNWSVTGNWSLGRAPIAGDNVFITNNDAASRTVTLDVSSKFLILAIGNMGTVANTLSQTSAFNLTASGGGEELGTASGSKGVHTQSAGTNTYTVGLQVGYAAGSTGTYNLSGGAVNITGLGTGVFGLYVGAGGTGTFSQTGGTVSLAANTPLRIASGAASTGTFTLNGASAALTDLGNADIGGSAVGGGGVGTLNVQSGTMTISGALGLWNAASSIHLTGGTLSVGQLNLNGHNTGFVWSGGGTLQLTGTGSIAFTQVPTGGTLLLAPASADSTITGPAAGITNAGTITFDSPTGNYDVTYAGNITNNATHAMRIRGGNGGARVIAGALDNFGAIAFNNADGTALAANSITMENGSQIFPSIGPPGASNTLIATNSGGLNLAGATINVDLGSARNVGPSGYSVGTYPLFHYNGALGGSVNNLVIQAGSSSYAYQFLNDAANGNVDLDIVPATGESWTGTTDATWNGANWSTATAPSTSQLATFPTPIPSGRAAITVGSGETANGLKFNDNYALNGGSIALTNGLVNVAASKNVTVSSALGGTFGLVKSGLGTLTLTGANNYVGPTVANTGTLTAGAANTFPSGGTLQASGGTLDTGSLNQTVATIIVSAGKLNVNGGTLTATNGVMVNAAVGGGSLNLHGGMLVTPSFQNGANNSALNWTGGTLKLTGTGAVPVSTVPAGATLALAPSSAGTVMTGLSLGTSGPAKPAVLNIPSPNFYTNRSGQAIDAIVIHTTEESYAATVSQFQTVGQDSANYVNNSDGTITEMVDPATGHAAWHATYYNDRSIGIENVGFSNQANTWNSANVASLEALVAYLAYTYNVPVLRPTDNAWNNVPITQTYPIDPTFNEPGIVAHGQIQVWDRYDPGQYFPWATFVSAVQGLIANSITPAPLTNNGTINVSNPGGIGLTYRGDITNVGAFNVTNTNLTLSGNVTNSGTIALNGGNVSVGTLTLSGAGSVSVTSGSGTVLRVQQVNMSGTGKINLSDAKMIVSAGSVGSWNGSKYSGVTGLIQSGRNGGNWNGSGIVTSQSAAMMASGLTTLAVAANADLPKGTFGGQSVSTSDVLVMYTYTGDADLNGKINGDDYFRIDSGFASHASGYDNGDFNYDGRIDADDYFLIDRNYARQGTVFSAGEPVELDGVEAVPEPGCVGGVLMVLGWGALSRKRRKS